MVAVQNYLIQFGGCDKEDQCYNDVSFMDNYSPCPSACNTPQGKCMLSKVGEYCQCLNPFTGSDCGIKMKCHEDCGEHGVCGSNGRCICQSGYTGMACQDAIPGCFDLNYCNSPA